MIRTLCAAALVCGASLTASAAPLAPSAPSAQSGVEKVHGYHRSCRGGPHWRHRHTWDGDRVRCGGYYYRYYREPGITLRFGTRERHHRHRHWRHDRD